MACYLMVVLVCSLLPPLKGESKYGGMPERLGMNLVKLNQTK